MSIEIKYEEPQDKPIESVKAVCDYREGDYIEAHTKTCRPRRVKVDICANGNAGTVILTTDDAEAFFKAGLELVAQQRRAK